MNMRVAVIGAGVAGLSTVWHLLENDIETVLYDAIGIGGGASGISTGLLHPFPGKKALRSWKADEGMQASLQLLNVAEKGLGRPVAEKKGIFRPAISIQQKEDFFFRALQDLDAEWKEISLPGMPTTSGLWIENGVTVYSRLYLQGLWSACEKRGALFIRERIKNLSELSLFDQIILTTGFETLQFEGCKNLPLKTSLGQTLLCKWEHLLPFSLVSQAHITPTEDPSFCQVGSTYEHTPDPDEKKIQELIDKAALFYPPAASFQIEKVRSGVRIAPKKGYRPIVQKISPNTWVFTGLGSRGMLYHAWLGKKLAKAIVEKCDSINF